MPLPDASHGALGDCDWELADDPQALLCRISAAIATTFDVLQATCRIRPTRSDIAFQARRS
jgi:hypothetical protein